MTQQIIAQGLRFPEGPIALPDGSVVLVEIEAGLLSRIWPDGNKTTVADLGGGPNGAAIGPDGSVYVCNNGGFAWIADKDQGLRPVGPSADYSGGWIERVDLETGAVTRLYSETEQGRLVGPNDLVFDDRGGFYFTDYGKVRPESIDRGAVYYGRTDGSALTRVVSGLLGPNGIGLSPDGSELYVAETYTGRLWAFDVDSPGRIAHQPWPESSNGGRLIYTLQGFRGFDSLVVDQTGAICLAVLYKGSIDVVRPDGMLLRRVPFDDPLTTNICFSASSTQAFVTLSSSGSLVQLDRTAIIPT